MDTFAVSSSILSATALNLFLRNKYNLSKNSECSLIKAGINHTYLITDIRFKYVFRVYSFNWRTQKEIVEELKLINHLNESGIPVSYGIKDTVGDYVQTLSAPEGIRLGVMFSYAEGEKLLDYSIDMHGEIGKVLGAMHNNTINFKLERVNYTSQILLIDSFEYLKKHLSINTDEMIFMSSTQKSLLEEFKSFDYTQIRQGTVHLDVWFDNLNINSLHNLTIFDFDFCGNGLLCLDIAYYLLQLIAMETNELQFKLKKESFLKGYESVAKISAEEYRILKVLGTSIYFFYLGVQCKRFDNWSNVFLNENYLKKYITVRVKRHIAFDLLK